MSGQRQLQLIALLWPVLARGAPEPFIEDRTLDGARVVLAPLAAAPVELRAFGGACAPCVETGAGAAELDRVAAQLARRAPAAPGDGLERARAELRVLAAGARAATGRGRPLIVIAGGFELDSVRAAVEERVGHAPATQPVAQKPRKEVERAIRAPSDRARLLTAMRAPAASASDAWAAAIVERLLAARLERRKLAGDERPARSVETRVEWVAGAELVVVELELSDGGAAAQARELVDDELDRLAREAAAPRELDAARRAIAAAPSTAGERLAALTLACGNPRLARSAAEDLARVSPAEVQRAAARLAERTHRSTVETFVTARAALPGERGAPRVP